MSGEPLAVEIPERLLQATFREARASYPAECCGWLTGDLATASGLRPCANAQASGEHPTEENRTAESAYVIAGADLIALSKSIDSETPACVIYHSHPNGRAYFSDTDRAVATSPWGDGPTYPVQQLVIGIDEQRVTEAALFAWSEAASGFVEVARFAGADL